MRYQIFACSKIEARVAVVKVGLSARTTSDDRDSRTEPATRCVESKRPTRCDVILQGAHSAIRMSTAADSSAAALPFRSCESSLKSSRTSVRVFWILNEFKVKEMLSFRFSNIRVRVQCAYSPIPKVLSNAKVLTKFFKLAIKAPTRQFACLPLQNQVLRLYTFPLLRVKSLVKSLLRPRHFNFKHKSH